GRFVAARNRRLPDDVARVLVEGDECRLASTRRADQPITIDQRRFGIRPVSRLTAEIRADVPLPADLSRFKFDTGQIAIGAERIESITVDGRRRSRTWILRSL